MGFKLSAKFGTLGLQNANAVAITGGTITGITDLAVADGGTGASDAATARTNLGLGTIATQAANNVAITGGSITGIADLAVADGGTGTSTGSITGIGALVFAAGGSNQNVTLTPSGSGYTILGGNVGIGTTSPGTGLHVKFGGASGATFTNSWGMILETNGNNNAYPAFWVSTAGANNAFIVAGGGNVGIGTTLPGTGLHVKFGGASGATFTDIWGMILETNGNDNAYPAFWVSTAGANNAFIVAGGGNVGIGTKLPKSALHVVGLPVYANNAAAVAGGLTAGAFYRAGGDPDLVCVVH